MKKVRVLYFAGLRDLVGRGEESVELPSGVGSVAAALAELQVLRPELKGRLGSVRAAVNEAFAQPEDPVADGDCIALIPPVSGG